MIQVLITFHILSLALALGGRILFIPVINDRLRQGINERLDELNDVFLLSKWADYGFAVVLATGIALFLANGISLTDSPWSFKLKLVTLLLLVTDVGAFHVAQMRVVNHYDTQMIPALKRLNLLAVILMSCMVFFATFS